MVEYGAVFRHAEVLVDGESDTAIKTLMGEARAGKKSGHDRKNRGMPVNP